MEQDIETGHICKRCGEVAEYVKGDSTNTDTDFAKRRYLETTALGC